MKKYDFHTQQSFSTTIIALPLYLLQGCQVLNCILHSGQNLDIYKHKFMEMEILSLSSGN